MREVALIPVASRMMESTGAIGYKLSAAVADVIDNSIAAIICQNNFRHSFSLTWSGKTCDIRRSL